MKYIIVVLCLIVFIQLYIYKLYKSSLAILLLCVFNTFVAPVLYYSFLKGDSYVRFTEYDYHIYMTMGVLILVWIIGSNFFRHKFISMGKFISKKRIKIKNIAILFSGMVVCVVICYVILFRDGFPVFELLKGERGLNSLERPDMTGELPAYFSVQTVMLATVPMIYLYFYERNSWNIGKKIVYSMGMIFFMIAGGNKGVLVYFVLFLWIFIWKAKVNWRIILAGAGCLCLYFLIMAEELDFENSIVMLLESPVRRFFITQGAMLINRIAMLNNGFEFSNDTISLDVYSYVYNASGGSAPTFFIGDFIIRYGYLLGLLLAIIIVSLVYYFSIFLDRENEGNLYKKWYFFFLVYLLGMSSVDLNFIIRFAIMTLTLSILMLDHQAKIRKQKICVE